MITVIQLEAIKKCSIDPYFENLLHICARNNGTNKQSISYKRRQGDERYGRL